MTAPPEGTLLVLHSQGAPPIPRYSPGIAELAELRFVVLRDPSDAEGAGVAAMRELGEVVVVDRREDVRDAALEIARARRVAGVLTFSEPLLRTAAEVTDALGLPGHPLAAADRMQRKDLQRAALAAAGLPTPAFALIEMGDDPVAVAAAARIRWPAVLKPVVGMSSTATRAVDGPDALAAAYAEALESYAGDPRTVGVAPRFQLEERLVGANWHGDGRFGDYVSVESMVVGGAPRHVMVTDKFPLVEPFRETGDLMPSCLPAERRAEVLEMAGAALRAVGARDGLTHTEIKLTPDGPVVIEVNGRVGGGVYDLIPYVADFDVLDAGARIALGLEPPAPPITRGVVVMLNPHSPAADVRVARISGEAEARAHPAVVELTILQPTGTVPAWRQGMSWLMKLVLRADDVPAALRARDELERRLRFAFEPA